jgi:hypothetical protein
MTATIKEEPEIDVSNRKKTRARKTGAAPPPLKEVEEVKDIVPPVEEVPPVKEGLPPVKEGLPPVKEGLPPVKDIVPPVKEVLLPVEEVPPIEEALPQVVDISSFKMVKIKGISYYTNDNKIYDSSGQPVGRIENKRAIFNK